MFVRLMGAALGVALLASTATAQTPDPILEKKTFELPSYTTAGGATIKNVKIGWEAYGTLNADKSNAILITHFFSATSHAFGKYAESDPAPGYWNALIGPGKAIDTNKYYVLSSDTLVNLNVNAPNVVTTGPASINPDTGKPYGMSFPIVGIKDFVNVQTKLIESLGIKKLHAVVGASMGGLQAYEWGQNHAEMVDRIVAVIASPAPADPYLIGWLDMWAAPIRLDPKWSNGDYYGKESPPKDSLPRSASSPCTPSIPNGGPKPRAAWPIRPRIRRNRSTTSSRSRRRFAPRARRAPRPATPTTSSIW
jgi:homoserine O-acetyltransferase